ncbi:MAG: DMT family transporter [Candidatus Cloacimonetes bacterium]|nr:DMT family transporter [Candidatus Cloacimonadota bacterium]
MLDINIPDYIVNYKGQIAALLTALCWTFTVLFFESAGKKIGSLAVNLIRLIFAFFFLSLYCLLTRGLLIPTDASLRTWFWLAVSGLIGFNLGDLCLFESFVRIGARVSMLIMSLVPIMTTITGWLILGEIMSIRQFCGMIITISGVAIVIFQRADRKRRPTMSYSSSGLFLAFLGAIGQAGGLVLSKLGMGNYNPVAATQIRVLSGMAGFSLLYIFWRKWHYVSRGLKNRKALTRIAAGAFFGPFLGVSLSLYAVQHTITGVAATIMALVPVIILVPAVIIFREKLTIKDVLGAFLAVTGTSLLFF